MKEWRIWFYYWFNGHIMEHSTLVWANSYDEALAKARELDVRYSAGQVVIDV